MRRLYWYDAVILRLVLDDFFRFWVFLVHPTVVSVLLSASVERCFVSRMRDFFALFQTTSLFVRIIEDFLSGLSDLNSF